MDDETGNAPVREPMTLAPPIVGAGGGIRNVANAYLTINASTITANRGNEPGGASEPSRFGGGVFNLDPARILMANTILAGNTDNRSAADLDYGPDCYSVATFNLSSQRDNLSES